MRAASNCAVIDTIGKPPTTRTTLIRSRAQIVFALVLTYSLDRRMQIRWEPRHAVDERKHCGTGNRPASRVLVELGSAPPGVRVAA